VAGMEAAVEYLEGLGRTGREETRRTRLERALASIRAYEKTLSMEMLRVLNESDAEVYGMKTGDRIGERVPTLCFNLPNLPPARVAEELAKRGIGLRDGHMYSPRLMRRLGLSPETGAVRASLVHYNTLAEVQDFAGALAEIKISC
jgi:selenocysteine lyase/cysteine desulfurase